MAKTNRLSLGCPAALLELVLKLFVFPTTFLIAFNHLVVAGFLHALLDQILGQRLFITQGLVWNFRTR